MSLYARPITVFLTCLTALILSACHAAPKRNVIDVAVTGVNYTEYEYSIQVHSLDASSSSVSSGELMPFSAGGQMCCFSLPKTWRPGLQVKVRGLKAIVENGDWIRDDITETIVDVLPYKEEELGTLWLLQLPDTKVEVVNSTVGPSHDLWNGTTKGWPEPSLKFQMKKWEKDLAEANKTTSFFANLLEKIEKNPKSIAIDFWDYKYEWKNKNPKTGLPYKDKDDPEFIKNLKEEFLELHEIYQLKTKQIQSSKPK